MAVLLRRICCPKPASGFREHVSRRRDVCRLRDWRAAVLLHTRSCESCEWPMPARSLPGSFRPTAAVLDHRCCSVRSADQLLGFLVILDELSGVVACCQDAQSTCLGSQRSNCSARSCCDLRSCCAGGSVAHQSHTTVQHHQTFWLPWHSRCWVCLPCAMIVSRLVAGAAAWQG